MIIIKSNTEIALMRVAGQIVAETLNLLEKNIKKGISTLELDKIAETYILSRGATASFKGYGGFPASACISINEEVVHGIPAADRVLSDGDIVSVDIGANYKGYHGDAARTFMVGNVTDEVKRLVQVTEESFFEGLKQVKQGNRLGDVSAAIGSYAESFGYGVVKQFVGHGVGSELHEDPNVPNYGTPGRGVRLKSGMTLAIEPMINMGTDRVFIQDNEWTVVTADKKPSAHYENTVLITDGEPEILTMVK